MGHFEAKPGLQNWPWPKSEHPTRTKANDTAEHFRIQPLGQPEWQFNPTSTKRILTEQIYRSFRVVFRNRYYLEN
jgi:hypothetical protein